MSKIKDLWEWALKVEKEVLLARDTIARQQWEQFKLSAVENREAVKPCL